MSSLIRYVATLAKMPAAEYRSNQQAAIDNRLLDDKSIEDEAMRYWSEIDGQSYAFRRAEEEAEAMRATSQQLLVRWLRESFLSPQTAKRLVVAIAPGRTEGRALYFTRATAPWGAGPHYHHIGMYAYRRPALERFVKLPPSPLEQREKLEQLRALEAGMSIAVRVVDAVPLGVDTPEDLERAKQLIGMKSRKAT